MYQPSPQRRDRSGYLSEDTIAALATAVGGAITIIRISGPDAFRIAGWLDGGKTLPAAPSRKLSKIQLRSPDGEWLDDALFASFVSPDSFTGENVLELHLHGSPFIAGRVLELLVAAGARQALPGEFSFRAVRNGKMSLPQAQAVADLIGASNEGAVRLALEKMSGSQNLLLTQLGEDLRKLAVLGELGIDFADQDVDEVSLPRLRERLSPLKEILLHLRDGYDRGSKIQDGVRVAFVGLPNAGKSSFFNALLGEDRSIVSEIPGTTRDVIRERITLRGKHQSITLRLEDTAGLRNSEHLVEKQGIARSERSAREADLILFLIDAASPIENSLLEWKKIGSPSDKTLGVFTKCDLISEGSRSQLALAAAGFGLSHWVYTSSQTGMGISEAIQTITVACGRWTSREQGELLLTRLDHLEAVKSALEHLERAHAVTELDLFAADVRQALHALCGLIGETPADDILGKIFADFCIGK